MADMKKRMTCPGIIKIVLRQYLREDADILDYDTGGGEFLLSLNHPFHRTAATEGYQPNVELCREKLLPLGIQFRECSDPSAIPFEKESFDLIINRHGDYDASEIYRLLRKGGIFVTEQVGGDNDRDLVEMVLPGDACAISPSTIWRNKVECLKKRVLRF